jgi:hypothetical protein
MRRRASAGLAVALGALGSASCTGGLHSASLIDSVRILSSSADEPYAAPGSTVTLQVLAVDARSEQPAPMVISWIPTVCEDPTDDAYYACFQTLGAAFAGDGGAGGSSGAGAGAPPLGVDLTPFLPTGPSFSFTMPADAVTKHAPVTAPTTPYGLAVVFNVACAGHLELVPLDPNNVQAPPIGCFDAQHDQLGPNDYVLGLTRVYAYDTLRNQNPVIDHVDARDPNGDPIDLTNGLSLPACHGDCPTIHIGPVVPASSQEVNPEERGVDGQTVREQIWADFFSDVGSFSDEARLLYDSASGSIGDATVTNDEYRPPDTARTGTIWIVVHDNRGGATWATVPVRASP